MNGILRLLGVAALCYLVVLLVLRLSESRMLYVPGSSRTLLVEEAPKEVVDTAVRAAGLIGDGLYGVDLKQNERGVFVIEINDNPSLDLGVEDACLKDELYRTVMREFLRRLEARAGR